MHGCAEIDKGDSRRQIKNKYDAEQISSVLEFLSCPTDIGQAGVTFFFQEKKVTNSLKPIYLLVKQKLQRECLLIPQHVNIYDTKWY